ncbi:hypothetical protein Adeg_0465 [Ammonifex degensii KC4]|uniref:Uncharacterized protein n=1 Tax=Ammonifex degensii (strain DSM 10501 / KC4) TaxID=429009 RepID=C9RBI9_AMMDK|nr:hypothetical protein [Ammonifex degensii]ACX51616.1 hypothetical protein Adeg_0465 [Ammonifex degensii KC4]
MAGKLPASQRSACEELLRQIPGVICVQVLLTPAEEVEAIHLLVASSADQAAVREEVRNILEKFYGVTIEPEKINIDSLPVPETGESSPSSSERRFLLAGLQVSLEGYRMEVQVKIKEGEKILQGQASGPAHEQSRRRLVAQAALSALQQTLPPEYTLLLGDLTTVSLGGRRVVLVGVILSSAWGEEFLVGSALEEGKELEGVVRAVLDAVDRRLGAL